MKMVATVFVNNGTKAAMDSQEYVMRGTDETPTKNIQSYQEMQKMGDVLPKVGIEHMNSASVPVTKKLGKLNITED